MSLIESALEKLRRSEEAEPKPIRSARKTSPKAAEAPVIPPAVVLAPVESTRFVAVDSDVLRSKGYLPEAGLERRFADHYRQIKRPLIDKALGGAAEARTVLVSSALPGDGKSFTSLNLALSIARERDVSVLLVDADAPRARISEVFGLRSELGLLDALADESLEVETLVARTDVRGFELLPAGRFIDGATELLASARMAQIAARLAARNPRRIIVFDSTPLLVSTEARVLARILGQIVLVVRAGVTPKQAILEALGYIDRSKLQGLVLNDAPFRSGGGYYGYSADAYGDAPAAETGPG